MVVNRDGERALGLLLADHIFVEDAIDLPRLREVVHVEVGRSGELLIDDLVAEIDALVTDVDAGAGDQLFNLPLRFAAKAAEKLLVRVSRTCHAIPRRIYGELNRRRCGTKISRRMAWAPSGNCHPRRGDL